MIEEQAFKEALERGYTFIQSVDDKEQRFLLVDVSHEHDNMVAFGDCLVVECLKGVKNKSKEK